MNERATKLSVFSAQEEPEDSQYQNAKSGASLDRGFGWVVSLWRGLVPFLRPHRAAFAVIGLLTCVELGLESWQRAAVGFVLDDAILKNRHDLLPRWLLLLLLALITAAVAGLVREWLYSKLCAKIPGEARARLFERIQMFPLGYLRSRVHGDLVTRVTVEASSIEPALWSLQYNLVAVTGGLFSVGLMVMTEWRLSLAAVLFLPLAVVAVRYLAARAAQESYLTRTHIGRLATFCHQNLANQVVLRVFGLAAAERERFARHNQRIIETSWRYNLFGYYTHRCRALYSN